MLMPVIATLADFRCKRTLAEDNKAGNNKFCPYAMHDSVGTFMRQYSYHPVLEI